MNKTQKLTEAIIKLAAADDGLDNNDKLNALIQASVIFGFTVIKEGTDPQFMKSEMVRCVDLTCDHMITRMADEEA